MRPGTWMMSCPEALRILELKKKQLGEIRVLKKVAESRPVGVYGMPARWWSWDSTLEEGRRFSELAEARPVGVCEMCRAFVEEIVSLPPHVEKP